MFVFNCSLNSNDEEDPSEKSSEALLFNSFKELSKAVLRSSEVLISFSSIKDSICLFLEKDFLFSNVFPLVLILVGLYPNIDYWWINVASFENFQCLLAYDLKAYLAKLSNLTNLYICCISFLYLLQTHKH